MNCTELLHACRKRGECQEFFARCRDMIEPAAVVTLAPGERAVVGNYVVEKTEDGRIVLYEL